MPADRGILDLACGSGRHARYFLSRGHRVTALDRTLAGVSGLADSDNIELVKTDLEDGTPWPFENRTFGAVVVVNYLHRPLLPFILDAVDENGILLYASFARGNEAFGRPRNPNYLLRAGELLDMLDVRFDVVAYSHGPRGRPPDAVRQRLCARRRA